MTDNDYRIEMIMDVHPALFFTEDCYMFGLVGYHRNKSVSRIGPMIPWLREYFLIPEDKPHWGL